MTSSRGGADPGVPLRRGLALAATLLLNVAFLAGLALLMRPGVPEPVSIVAREPHDIIQVRLIEAPSSVPPPAMAEIPLRAGVPSAPPAFPTSPPRVRAARGPSRSDATSPAAAVASVPSDVPTPQFFDIDGRVRLPEAVADSTEKPFPQRPPVPAEGNPLVHREALPYEPTRFDKHFPPVRETLGGELVRKATVERTVRTAGGMQITCAWVLFFGGCGWGYAPVAPIEELKAMRVELPPLKPSVPDAANVDANAAPAATESSGPD